MAVPVAKQTSQFWADRDPKDIPGSVQELSLDLHAGLVQKYYKNISRNWQGTLGLFGIWQGTLELFGLFAEVWSPSPVANQPQKQQVEDVIEKEGHRVIIVETYDKNGHHNTKVSISPEQSQPQPQQHERQDSGVKFKSPSLVEKAKEKMEEAADYVSPNIGQGISHGSGDEKHYPTELVCDKLGKCTHRMAKVLHKATDKVSEAAHDVVDKKKEMDNEAKEEVKNLYKKQKEMVHGTKDKVEGLYEEAKDTASEKAREAKEFVEDAYEKVKEKTAEKAHVAKECAQESMKKAKDAVKEAKDLGKTIRGDVAGNITETAEDVTEQVVEKTKEAKESIKHATNRVSNFVNRAKRYVSEAMTSLMGVVNLLGFGIAYGMCVWVTFISSYVLARVLPRQQFGVVQSKIYPVYFRAMAYSIGLALLGHLLAHRRRLFTNKAEMFQACNLLTSILVVLVNLLYLEPLATKAMFERMKIEKEEGRGRGSPTAESREARHEHTATDPSGTTTTTGRAEERTPAPAQENRDKEEIRSRIRTMNLECCNHLCLLTGNKVADLLLLMLVLFSLAIVGGLHVKAVCAVNSQFWVKK
ncbi:unnamed protein product [Dovyalis caffra]|uniref:TMEM205-like domain-containing protein n=1 Tax=Dovyalis caffra TaxID=77055 RepID=A0AAV1S4H0_9ROSI|nr:unnamed protein product [Dovyalis caffra]